MFAVFKSSYRTLYCVCQLFYHDKVQVVHDPLFCLGIGFKVFDVSIVTISFPISLKQSVCQTLRVDNVSGNVPDLSVCHTHSILSR